jgi:hypothetical protein
MIVDQLTFSVGNGILNGVELLREVQAYPIG